MALVSLSSSDESIPIDPTYVGLSPVAGNYQIDFTVPDAAPGDWALLLSIGGISARALIRIDK